MPGAAVTALAAEVEDAGAAALRTLSSSTVTATGTSGTVTWTLYGDGELVLAPTSGSTGTLESFSGKYDGVPWYSYRESVVSVTVSGTVVCGSSVAWMFGFCSSLESLDLSGLDTSNVTDMHDMFLYCSSLESLDLSDFVTSSVTDMVEMFFYCSSLEFLDLSSFDTSSVVYMPYMFYGCSSLESLDLSSFDTASVAYMDYMFSSCALLATIYVSELWSTDSVTSSPSMFKGCTSLVGGNGTAYSSSHVNSEYARIDTDDTPGYFTYKAYSSNDDDTDPDSLLDDIIDAITGSDSSESSLSLDVWSFSNSRGNFTNGYGLTEQDYEKLQYALKDKQCELAELTEKMEREVEDFGGSCRGMSTWVVLTALGVRDAADIDGTTETLYDYSNTEDVLSAINFYHLQNCLEPFQSACDDFMALDTKEQVDELAALVEDGTPTLLVFEWYACNDDASTLIERWTYNAYTGEAEKEYEECGHAIVAHGLEDGDYTDYVNGLLGDQAIGGVEFTHRVITYDCSHPDGGEAYYLYYADDGTWCIPGWHVICEQGNSVTGLKNNARLNYAGSATDVLNTVDYVTGECEYTGTYSYGSFSSLSTTSYSYDASWASGSASVSGFTVTDSTGDGDVNVAVDANVTADGDTSGSAATTAYLPVAGSYTVTPADDEVSLYLQGGDYLTSVEADAAGSATFYSDGGAALSTASATDMTISVTANSGASTLPWATVEVAAEGATELTADLTEDGLVITGADVDEVVVTTYEEVGDEGEETTVETDGGAVLITADSEDEVVAEEGYDYTPATDEEREANRTAVTDISEAEVTWKATGYPISDSTFMWYIYNGKARTPGVVVTLNGATLKKGTDYTVSYSSNKSVGTATVTVKGTGAYIGKVTGYFSIYPASNPAKVKKKTATVKYKKLKKKKRTVKAITVTKAKGKVTYKKKGGSKKLTVNKKTGKITVKKGTKKGTYKIKVAVTAYGTWNYAAMTKTVTVKVKVK